MVVRVVDSTNVAMRNLETSKATVRYDNGTLFIDCNLDLVSLGVAVGILQQIYDEYVDAMDPEVATTVRDTIKEVINGQD